MKKSTSLVMLFLLAITFQSFAQPGARDLSFNKTGKQSFTLKTNASNDYITTSFLQPDGKLLVAGYYIGNFLGQRGFISRLKATGEMDPSFGNNGRIRFEDFEMEDVYMSDFIAQSIALQSTGNIVLAGHYGGDGYQPAIANLLPDGSLNKQFNGNGYKIIEEDEESDFSPSASLQTVQVHPSTDNIIAGGYTSFLGDFSYMLTVALDKFGAPFTYNNKEYLLHQIGGFSSNITCSVRFHADSMYLGVNQDADGFSIAGVTALSMVTGQYNEKFGDQYDVLLFNMGGYERGLCNAIALTTNKDILLAGYGTDGGDPYKAVVHKIFASSESEDILFGSNGSGGKDFQFESFSTGQELNAISVDANNNIVAVGYYTDEFNQSYWAAARLNANGQLAGFDGDGLITFPIKNYEGIASIHAVTGGYLLTGTSIINSDPFESDGIVKKIDNTGSAAAYGNDSEATVWARDHFATAENMTLYNGRLWVCGNIPNNNIQQNGAIAVLNASTGAIDVSFGGKLGAAPGAFLIPASSAYPNMWIRDLRFQGNKLIVAATYFNIVTDADELLLMRYNLVNNSLELDTEFGENGYAVSTINAGGIHRVQGLLVQNNGKIIVYGYFGGESAITVLGFTADGDVDAFADGGAYVHAESPTDPGERKTMDGKILSNGTLAFTTSIYGPVSGSSDILVFILDSGGVLVSSQYYDLFAESSDGACALAEKADHSLFIGGYSNDAYTILSLKTNGMPDTDFDGDGKWVIPNNDNTDNERIVGLYVNGQSLVAVGRAYSEGGELITTMRLTLRGRNDSTFIGKGYAEIGYGKGKSSLLANDRLYIAGNIEEDGADMVYGDVYKILLGSGPVIKETKLVLQNEIKTLGQEAFVLRKTTNSPAPITYKIIQGTNKATINPTTGLVTMLHSTYESSPVVVRATQAAIPGYSAATSEAYITINRGIPTIVFTNQGGLVNQDTLKLAFSSNSKGYYYFSSVGASGVFEFYGEDYVIITGLGEGKVGLSIYGSSDYEDGYAEATISGYNVEIPPVANRDEVELILGREKTVVFNVVSNDEAFTGSIVNSKIDLDPAKPGVQNVYLSPALGFFEVDITTGDVSYTPFSAFIGSGEITYTITDTKNNTSEPAVVAVTVVSLGGAPALKATELITPNNDGLNDAFVIGFIDLEKENTLRIFDRTGSELFVKTNYRNDWTGELANGQQAENGTYFYVFVEVGSDKNRELKGAVELRK